VGPPITAIYALKGSSLRGQNGGRGTIQKAKKSKVQKLGRFRAKRRLGVCSSIYWEKIDDISERGVRKQSFSSGKKRGISPDQYRVAGKGNVPLVKEEKGVEKKLKL